MKTSMNRAFIVLGILIGVLLLSAVFPAPKSVATPQAVGYELPLSLESLGLR